jgi:hypothetical protein
MSLLSHCSFFSILPEEEFYFYQNDQLPVKEEPSIDRMRIP